MTTIPRSYLCYRTDAPLVIDGDLGKPAWRDVPWTESFVDIEGDVKPLPPFQTRVKMLWDDRFFYIAADMEEPHVWATLTEHDSVIFQDNDFEIFIDPEGDNHEYYEIEINALNTVWDLRLVKPYRDGGPALNEWEIPGLRTAVQVRGTLNDARDTDDGWSVEIALPWEVLGEYARGMSAPPQEGDRWRVNFSRVEWDVTTTEEGGYRKIPDRPEHNWVWSPQGVIDMHRPERWGYVQFVHAAPGQPAAFHPDPSLAARDYLMAIYHAQHAHRKETGSFATALETLSVSLPPAGAQHPELRSTPEGFVAGVDYGADRRLFVRQDSLLWSEPRTA